MISARLYGGLGNQLFQLSAAQALAWRNNDEAIFDFEACYTPLQGFPATKYADSIFRKIKNGKIDIESYYKEPSHRFSPIPYAKNLLIDGYFQSEKYFEDFKEEILDLFVLEKMEGVKDLTSIHVRRGDYLNNPDIFPQCPISYYQHAMEIIGGRFVVVSDDIQWCKENIKGDNIQYSELGDEVLEMSLMAQCKNNIIANSSFSLWGAMLNKNESKIVVAPEIWFGPKGPDYRDIVPENFLRL